MREKFRPSSAAVAAAGQNVAPPRPAARLPPVKRLTPLVLVLALTVALVVPFAHAALTAPASAAPRDRSPAAPVATAISTITGIAISPLLGTSAYGAYQWFTAPDDRARAALPWFAQWTFWVPALLLVGVCAAKDTLGTVVPAGLKKPLDVLETLENKVSGLVAAGAVVPLTMDTVTRLAFGAKTSAVLPELGSSGLAMIHVATFDASRLLDVLTVPFGLAVFVVVWLASHAINVLILLSPWGAIDAALKSARTALLGVITLTAALNPWVGAALSLVVIVIAYLVAGWAFRLTCFGSVFCWEFLSGRKARFRPAADGNRLFSGGALTGVPIRTYGRLQRTPQGALEFVYRPWLVLAPRTAPVPGAPGSLAVGAGAFFSEVIAAGDVTLFTLPPRYRGHEEELARLAGLGGVRPIGLRKAWHQLRALLGGRAASPA